MGETHSRAAAPVLLHYRPWRGVFRGPSAAVWPTARTALLLMVRRRLFWGLYAFSLVVFLLFFFGQYLVAWAQSQPGEDVIYVDHVPFKRQVLLDVLSNLLKFNAPAETYRNYFRYQGSMVMVVLALAGSVLIGNDFRFGSLPFYLSKPMARGHYLLGKGLAVAVFINLMTTLPALLLFAENGLIYSWEHFLTGAPQLLGVLGYGAVLTVGVTPVLLATAVWLRKTAPLVMTWTALFVLAQLLATALVDRLHLDPHWRLIDLWDCTYRVGNACLRTTPEAAGPRWYESALVLGGTILACLSYLILRLRAVEVVR